MLPEFATVSLLVPMTPVVVILLATALKDALEDWRRHQSDSSVNKSPAYILDDWNNCNFPNTASVWHSLEMMLEKACERLANAIISSPKSVKKYPEKLQIADVMKSCQTTSSPRMDLTSLSTDNWSLSFWKNIKGYHLYISFLVGDFILLKNNDKIPADVILIASGEPDCACYVETKNLDGETNLKIKRGAKELAHVKYPEDCRKLKCAFKAEAPSTNLYTFSGTMTCFEGGKETVISYGPSALLLRGCIIRNTTWVIGMVVYTGADTKIMLNAGPTPTKRSKIDKQINPQVMLIIFIIRFCSMRLF